MSWQKNKGNFQNCQQSTNPASLDTLKLASPKTLILTDHKPDLGKH